MSGYGTEAGFEAWLEATGRTLPNGSPDIAVLLERGSIYIDSTYGPRFVGEPTDPVAQEREWPRTNATIYDVAIATDAIPARVVAATYEAAWMEANSPGSLSVTVNPNARVKRNKVDVIEQEFFEPSAPAMGTGSAVQATLSSTIEGLLFPLLDVTADGYGPIVLVV
jgi:hypothetical protein